MGIADESAVGGPQAGRFHVRRVGVSLVLRAGAGKWRLEGKEYVGKDGDVLHFRFNV